MKESQFVMSHPDSLIFADLGQKKGKSVTQKKSSEEIAIKAINIASEICVYTNNEVRHLTLKSK